MKPGTFTTQNEAPQSSVPRACDFETPYQSATSGLPPGSLYRHTDPMKNNEAFRALFTLPPIQPSANTALSVPEMPAPKVVTGDRELDAVLWLQECVSTGHQVLIDKALEAAKKITTPMKVLSLRYGNYLARQHGSSFMAALGSMNFGELESLARNAIEKMAKQHDALSRFGSVESLFSDTPAEAACKKTLRGLKQKKTSGGWHEYDHAKTDARFNQHPDLRPHSLADCLHAMTYESALYRMRHACADDAGDHSPEFQEHADYCFRQLALIPPRCKEEALAVFDYTEESDAADRTEFQAIMRNLVAGGWA